MSANWRFQILSSAPVYLLLFSDSAGAMTLAMTLDAEDFANCLGGNLTALTAVEYEMISIECGDDMSRPVAELEAEIRSLNSDDKTGLIRALLAELDGPVEADVERAWIEEAQQRHREIIDGTVQPVPADRVFENLRARLNR
jgi:hypothetical protein